MSNGRVKQTLSVIDEAVARLTMRANYLDQLTLQGAEPTTLERALRYVETSQVATMPPPATATRSAASSQPRTAAVAPQSNSLLSERLESLSVQRSTPAPAAAAVHVSSVTQPRIRPAAAAVGSQSIVPSTQLNGRIAATASVPYTAGLRANPGPQQQEGGAFVPFGLSDNQRQQLVQSIMRDYATGAIPIHAASAPTGSSIQHTLQQSTMTTTTTTTAAVADVSEIRPTSADYALLRIRAAQQQPDSSGRLLAAAVSVGGDAALQMLNDRHDADVTQDVSRHDDEERRYVDDDDEEASLQPNESGSAPVPTAGANVYGSTQRPSGQPRYPYTSADVSSVLPTETDSVQYPHDGHSMQPRRHHHHHHQAAQPVLPSRVHSVAPVDIAPPAISTQSIQELLSLVRQPLSSDQRASLFAIAQAGFEGIALQSRLAPTTANGTPTVSPVYRKYLNICSDQATPLRSAGEVFTAIVHLANAQQQPEERVAADARSKHHRLLSSATSRISVETASLMRELGCTVVENACDEATPAASVSPQRRGATKTSSKVLQEPAVCETIPEQLRNVKYVSAKRRTDSVNPIVSRCASSRLSIAKRAVSSSPRRLKIQ